MIDAMRFDRNFWCRFQIDLTTIKAYEKESSVNNDCGVIKPPQKHGLHVTKILPVFDVKCPVIQDPLDIDLDL